MGGGSWTNTAYVTHSTVTRGFNSMDDFLSASTSQLYKATKMSPDMDPKGVVRECCDSDEHPNSLPVILALDVTGSMGSAASAVAKKLGDIMSDIFKANVDRDVEFCVMAIGDQEYDECPYQVSQFESDIRIAEALEKIYFEGCGGGNDSESYVGAWLWANERTKCDCWSHNGRGILITMGDECPTPRITDRFKNIMGTLDKDIYTQFPIKTTSDLYDEISKKWNIYHISIDDPSSSYSRYKVSMDVDKKWKDLIGQNYMVSTINKLPDTISNIIIDHVEAEHSCYEYADEGHFDGGSSVEDTEVITGVDMIGGVKTNENGEVVW